MADGVELFVGPSLPRPPQLPADWQVRPPARRGDIYRALRHRPRAIVLIDGEFHGSPAVWHRELLDAIAEGVAVVGASSMGALRAAELDGLGMIGCGRIFEAFRDGVLNADDEVALVYGPEAVGYPAMSEPLVNLRATLARARAEGVIDSTQEEVAVRHAKARHFADRSHAAVLEAPPFTGDPGLRERYAGFVASRAVDQKGADAREAVALVLRDLRLRQPPATAVESLTGGQWSAARLGLELGLDPAQLPKPRELLTRAGLPAEAERAWWQDLSWRWFARQWLHDRGDAGLRHGSLPSASPPGSSSLTAAAQAQLDREAAEADEALARALRAVPADAAAIRIERRLDAAASGPAGAPEVRCARRLVVHEWASARGLVAGPHLIESGIRRIEALLREDRPTLLAGLSLSDEAFVAALTRRITADWVVDSGPAFFGHSTWSFQVVLLRELQRRGLAPPLTSQPA